MRWWGRVRRWFARYGFAALVVVALSGGILVGLLAKAPEGGLPDLAFGSLLLYKLELGGLAFVFGYLAVLAFVLALNGRGFTHIGPKGVKADIIVNRTIGNQEKSIGGLKRSVQRNATVAEVQVASLKNLKSQVVQLIEVVSRQQETISDLKQKVEQLERRGH